MVWLDSGIAAVARYIGNINVCWARSSNGLEVVYGLEAIQAS
jgi:hypothetical protein